MTHFWRFLTIFGHFLTPLLTPFFTILAYFLGDFWKVGYKKRVKKGSILAILVTFWVIFGPFFDPFLVLSGYFQGAFWRPLILGVSKSVIFGIKNNRELNSKFWSFGSILCHLFCTAFQVRTTKRPGKWAKSAKKEVKKGVKKGSILGLRPPPGGPKWPPFWGRFFQVDFSICRWHPQLLTKIGFFKWPENRLFEKLIYKMSSTLTCVCACARARARPLFIY